MSLDRLTGNCKWLLICVSPPGEAYITHGLLSDGGPHCRVFGDLRLLRLQLIPKAELHIVNAYLRPIENNEGKVVAGHDFAFLRGMEFDGVFPGRIIHLMPHYEISSRYKDLCCVIHI